MHSPRLWVSDGAELVTPRPRPAALVLCPIPMPAPWATAGPSPAMIYQLAYERSLEASRLSLRWSSLSPSLN
jgi:hypothetical protein